MLRLMDATSLKSGNAINIDGKPCIVTKADSRKTGKHGHVKVKIVAKGVFDDKKKVIAVPGHERFEVPEIKKSEAQVLSIQGDEINVMDSKSYETLNIPISDEMKEKIDEGDNIEYWGVGDKKMIKRKL